MLERTSSPVACRHCPSSSPGGSHDFPPPQHTLLFQALTSLLASRVRWAAKEATKKAVSAQLGWHDIVVEVTHGQPYVVFRYPYRLRHEEALSADAGRFDDYEERAGKLSISHDGDYAVATVLVDLGQ